MTETYVQLLVVALTASCLVFILGLTVWLLFGEVARLVRYINRNRRK